MSNTPHDLAEEFPAEAERIRALKAENAHFARLFDEYNDVNHEVFRAETLLTPTAPAHEAELRQQRLRLKDEIWKMLRAG